MTTIYQSDAWAAFQRNLGHAVFQRSGAGWDYLAYVKSGRGWSYLYSPYGPRADTPEAFDAALADLARTARQQKCWFVRVEPFTSALADGNEAPEEALRRRGLRRTPVDTLAARAQVIDLSPDEDVILQGMEATNRTRYRNIHKKGVTFTTSTDPADIEILLLFLNPLTERKGFKRKEDDYIREAARSLMPLGAATLYVARVENKPIGAALVYDSDTTRSSAYWAMDLEHRRLKAGNPLVVRLIMDAKAKGLARIDLGGVAPENAGPEHEWYGFSKFKKSFGGQSESYPGTWDLPVSPVKYATFPVLRAARENTTMARRGLQRRLAQARSATSSSARVTPSAPADT